MGVAHSFDGSSTSSRCLRSKVFSYVVRTVKPLSYPPSRSTSEYSLEVSHRSNNERIQQNLRNSFQLGTRAGYNHRATANLTAFRRVKGSDLPGQLFTDYYLTEGIRDTDEWRDSVSSPGEFEAFGSGVRERYETVSGYSDPNEAVTERDLIEPVLRLLGWHDYLPQQGSARNEDIPDLLLFPECRLQGTGRRKRERRSEVPGWRGCWGEQEVRSAARCPGPRRPASGQDPSRADPDGT